MSDFDPSQVVPGELARANAFGPVLEALGEPGSLDLLPTPALSCEIAGLQRNIERLQAVASARGIRLRPHFKSHKCAFIAQRQIDAGASGISCAKLSEAEALVGAYEAAGVGAPPILITSPIATRALATRAVDLACSCELSLAIDRLEAVEEIARAARESDAVVTILCDVNVGLGRTGAATPEAAVEIAERASSHRSLRFSGLQGYAGHSQHVSPRDERRASVGSSTRRLSEFVEQLDSSGLSTEVRTGGGTGSWLMDVDDGVLNELQCGSYLFMDREYRDALAGDPEDCFEQSLFIVSSVISANQPGFVTIDAGLKSMSTDAGVASVVGDDGRSFHFFGDEHGMVTNGQGPPLRVGERVRLVPPHCDPTVNLYDLLWLVEGDRVLGCTPITARGRSY